MSNAGGTGVPSNRIGVLLVHGIGEQRLGDTMDKFLRGFARGVPDATLQRIDDGHATITLPQCELSVGEAWWAQELPAKDVAGSFDPRLVHVIAWFPWLNLRFGCYPGRPVLRSLLWTVILGPLAVLLQLSGAFVALILRALHVPLKRLGDQVVADVQNYVSSAARTTRPASPLHDAADRIQQRFADALEDMRTSGCNRVIVVAHSLGTVVAFHGLTGLLSGIGSGAPRPAASPQARALVSDLVTIGSPLEKIRFIWPRLVETTQLGGAMPGETPGAVRWHNMRDRLDLVAGKLRHRSTWGVVSDHPLIGRAWLANAHTAYEQNPAFLRLLLDAADAGPVAVRDTPLLERVRLFTMSLLMNVGALAAVCALLAITALLTALVVLVLAAVITVKSVGESGASGDQFTSLARTTFDVSLVLLPIVYGLVVPLGWGRVMAGFEHYGYRYGRWLDPATFSDRTDAPRDRLTQWANDPRRWWNRSLTGRRGRLVALALLITAGLIGAVIWAAAGWVSPFRGDVAWTEIAAIVLGAITLGALAELVLGMSLALLVLMVTGSYKTWRAYRRWVWVTTTPPD
jgi:hypothetical protein